MFDYTFNKCGFIKCSNYSKSNLFCHCITALTRPFFSFCKSNHIFHILFLCLHTALKAFSKILTKRFNTFRFLAKGDSYISLALSYRVSPSAIGKIVPETCTAIWNILYPQELLPPSSQQEWLNIAREFQLQWNFPMCCRMH